MTQQYSIEQVPEQLSNILQEVEQGETVQILQQGRQVTVILSTAKYDLLRQKKGGFSSALQKFRQEMLEEGVEMNPDEVWGNVRDRSLEGR